eukprot:10460157-Alexandrium_andersonii.AAC.1
MHASIPDVEDGQPMPPVREHGPTTVAPRIGNPEGTLKRSIGAQEHSVKSRVHPRRLTLPPAGLGLYHRSPYAIGEAPNETRTL